MQNMGLIPWDTPGKIIQWDSQVVLESLLLPIVLSQQISDLSIDHLVERDDLSVGYDVSHTIISVCYDLSVHLHYVNT